MPSMSSWTYAITSFNNRYDLRTRIAAERLLSRLEGNTDPPVHCEVMGRLVEGNTVRRIANHSSMEDILL